MSIDALNDRVPKRRKLSHSSNDASDNEARLKRDRGIASISALHRSRTNSAGVTNGSGNSMAGSGISKTSMLSLQVAELLDQVRSNSPARLREAIPHVDNVVRILKHIPSQDPLSLSKAAKQLQNAKVSIPWAGFAPDPEVKYKFAFISPSTVCISGNLIQGLSLQGDEEIELVAEMPMALFQEKDYLNYRAFHKRSFYLACLAAALRKELNKAFEIQFGLKDDNPLLPVIFLTSTSTDTTATAARISVNVAIPFEIGPLEKLTPERNCVRHIPYVEEEPQAMSAPTPIYNSSLRQLASAVYFHKLIESASKNCAAFKDSCILGQIWLRQRGFIQSNGCQGFSSRDWILMTALLLTGGGHKGQSLFSARYTSIQLFKAVLQVLSTRDLSEQPLVVQSQSLKLESGSQPTLYDAASGVNLFYRISSGVYSMLRRQAELSLESVNARKQESFDSLFILKASDPALLYDEVYQLDASSLRVGGIGTDQEVIEKLYGDLKQALTDRVSLLVLHPPSAKLWKVGMPRKVYPGSDLIRVGLILDSSNVMRVRDDGPPVEEREEARAFRDFWGEKSELRRFKDGRIIETVTWSVNHPITFQIIQHVAVSRFGLLPSSVVNLNFDLPHECLGSPTSMAADTAFSLLGAKYQDMASKLHQLEGLPLPIQSIFPSHSALRSSSRENPFTTQMPHAVDVVIQFDSSARWPDNLTAIQYTKIALLAKLADLLAASDDSLATRVGIENTERSTTGYYNTSFLDLIYQMPGTGSQIPVVFRLRVFHDREQHLLHTNLDPKTTSSNERELASRAIAVFKREFVASPAHTAAIRNLITRFPPLSTTIRLLKVWTSSHHLSNHLPEPILEIIAAKVFLQTAPWFVPGSANTAFLRCLHFLSHWDWVSTPLIVDLSLSQDMPLTAHSELTTRFQAWRKLDPGMHNIAWFVGTNIDGTGTVWTQSATPARVVAARVTALAKAATAIVHEKRLSLSENDWRDLFSSPLADFDFVIHLKASVVGGVRKAVSGKHAKVMEMKFKNLLVQEQLDVDRIGQNVVSLYIQDLERSFDTSALFFYGEGDTTIAGLWKPHALGEREWRVRLQYSTIPKPASDSASSPVCNINKQGILAEIAIMGQEMVEKITSR